jgi:hypothetical protein
MLRTFLAAAVVYAYGHPSFDGHRPAPFDKPVQGFYEEVNVAANDGRQAFAGIDMGRLTHYLDVLLQRLGDEIHSFKQ